MQCLKQAQALVSRGHEVTILTRWLRWGTPRHEVMDGVVIRRAGWLLPLTMGCRDLHDRLVQLKIARKGRRYLEGAEGIGTPETNAKRFRWMSIIERPGAWSFIEEVSRWIHSGRITADVVHVHESHWLAGFAQWVGEQLKVPVFCKEAILPVLGYGGASDIPRSEEWRARRMKCRFIAMTSAIAQALAEGGVPSENIQEIPNGVYLPDQVADPGTFSDALYVGNFTQGAAHKGFDILFKAWGLVMSKEPGIQLRVCGAGDVERWKSFADEQGCRDSILFEGRVVDVADMHRRSGFLVLPSRKEGISNALLEAMASGLPAVVSNIPGNTVAVRDGIEGFVVPVGDVDALASSMLNLIRNPELRGKMGRAARERAERVFAMDAVSEQLERAYRQAIHAP